MKRFIFLILMATQLFAIDQDSTDAWKKASRTIEKGSLDSVTVLWRHKFEGTNNERYVELKITNEHSIPVIVRYLTKHRCQSNTQKEYQSGDWSMVKLEKKGHSAYVTTWWADDYPCRRFKFDGVSKIRVILNVQKDEIAAVRDAVLERRRKLEPDTTEAVTEEKKKRR